jgi:hypothetical protein
MQMAFHTLHHDVPAGPHAVSNEVMGCCALVVMDAVVFLCDK